MPERPLLLFPTPEEASRSGLGGSAGHVRKPTAQRQWERLSPLFGQLQAAFDSRRVELQQTSAGTDPEQVLVIETIGGVENFANAVRRIQGFEWMGEVAIDGIAPDEDFHDQSKPETELSGRLYLVMSNRRALDEMLSLWQRYQANTEMVFERGLARFRDVFLCLKTIRRWGVQDRLLETGLIEAWQQELEYGGDRTVRFEAELWYRGAPEGRLAGANRVTELVQRSGGRVLAQWAHEGIAYHGVLAELPARTIRSIVREPTTELVKCESVMFFRPVGQALVGDRTPVGEQEAIVVGDMPAPSGEPVVAVLDGVPLANHRLLAGRVQVDDPDSWEAEYAASERIHGTAIASLIVHGDLNQPAVPLPRPVYVRPIMKPLPWPRTPRPEGIPDDCLAVDLIHRAVKRMFEGEGAEGPVASQVKIVNLSIGDKARPFTQFMSPVARLLDWLSAKYGVLFVVSAGNHTTPVSLAVSRAEFDAFQPGDMQAATIKALYRDARHRRLLSPAETINGLTIGAVHQDASQVSQPGARFDPFAQPLPSPVSAFGSGYRRSIKPDMAFVGGRQWYEMVIQTPESVAIEPATFRIAPGNRTASPGDLPGVLTATSYSCGTSNATALVSRAAGICYDSIQQILNDQAAELDSQAYEVPLLKAMLVHGCAWSASWSRVLDVLRTPENGRQLHGLLRRWVGYGMPEVDRVLDCAEQRATLLGFGRLADGEAHVFRLPLPPSLASRPEWRRLTVTLAWMSPISARTQKYRTASLWFETTNNALVPTRKDPDWQAVRRGTVQHEVFEGQRAEPFIDGESIQVKVNCREDAGRILAPIPYGLVVSLEVSEGVDVAVYDEVRIRIAPAIQIRQTTTRSGV